MSRVRQPWLYSASVDLGFLLFPGILSVALAALVQSNYSVQQMPIWVWLVFVLGIDVAHVYGTLFRTYWNKDEFRKKKPILLSVPILCWVGGVLLYSFDSLVFWRALAYLAVFHFVRQQYGFLSLYCRKDTPVIKKFFYLDTGMIYLCSLYPLIFWHTHLPQNFSWFVEGDFVTGMPEILDSVFFGLYLICFLAFFIKEMFLWVKYRFLNFPKIILILSTAIVWYFGIVINHGDIGFTITNVVAHGIPYLGLIWIFGRRERHGKKPLKIYSVQYIPVFLMVLVFLAYVEEGIWDGLIWREHGEVFYYFSRLPLIHDPQILTWVVPLLSLPQSTHYVLDGFIWRFSKEPRETVFLHEEV